MMIIIIIIKHSSGLTIIKIIKNRIIIATIMILVVLVTLQKHNHTNDIKAFLLVLYHI